MQPTVRVFVSSFSSEDPLHAREDDKLRNLREELWRLDPDHIWVAEHSEISLGERALFDPLAVADDLVDRLNASSCVVVILAGSRHEGLQIGSPLRVGGKAVITSHFEIELLTAAISGKPIHLFKLQGFDPGPRLCALLECLRFAYPGWSSRDAQSGLAIISAVDRILRSNPVKAAPSGFNEMQQVIRGFFFERGRKALAGESEIAFLDGEFEVRGGEVDVAAVEQALTGGTGFVEGSVPNVEGLDIQKKLSRAWIALRELMACSFDPNDAHRRKAYRPELLPLWDRALNAWAGAAAWSSLHGHIYLGPVAALSAIAQVRSVMRQERGIRLAVNSESLLHPHGGYASAWYSVAKRLPFLAARRAYLHSRRHANLGLVSLPEDSGLHALRGSIELRLGRPWRAVADYEKAWRKHPMGYVECPETGQIMTELAYGSVFVGRWMRARQLADRGLQQMRQLRSEDGFLARALRKCAWIHNATGNFPRARELREEARETALRIKAFDQFRGA